MSSSFMILWLYAQLVSCKYITAAQYCFKIFVVEHAPSKLFTATLRALLLSISAWIRSWSPARVCLNGYDDIIYLPLVLAMHNRWYTGQCVCGCKCVVSALVSHVASSSVLF